MDADAELKQDSLIRLFSFVEEGDWSAVQLRKSVTNVSKNFLTSCQSMEMAMDAVSYTHLRAHETVLDLVCRLLLEKKC